MPHMYHKDTRQLQEIYKRQLWREVGVWMQDRAQTLWDGGFPDEAAALYSEFAVDTQWKLVITISSVVLDVFKS